jgi:UDP-N-acetylmuramoyl-L-alanyl-D-glutamate--2,6-diaminopimelate ligase
MDAAQAGATAILTDEAEAAAVGEACPQVAIVAAADVPRAAALLAERFYGNPSSKLDVVAVTGTNGKTTTTWLLWQLMNAAGRRCGLIGTVVIDDGRETARAMMTTPPAIEMSRTLASMVEAGCVAVTLEASSHALDQKRVEAVSFDVACFTNLTQDHLDYHGTMERYAAAKARLFEMLPKDGRALVNVGDPFWERMVRDCRAEVVRCRAGVEGEADWRVEILSETLDGMRVRLTGPSRGGAGRGGDAAIEALVPLIGSYNAMNLLQAVASASALGLSADEIRAGLAGVSAPPGRIERVSDQRDDVHVFVDYAHTEDGLHSVLRAVAAVRGSGRMWVVFGCGGDRDRTKRPKMGAAAAAHGDVVVVTSDNPRTERPGDIIDMVLAGIPESQREKVTVQADRARAIRHAVTGAAPGDVVVIAGKGHETEQILPDGRGGMMSVHFDDREVAREALEARRGVAVVVPPRRKGTRRGRDG